MRKNHWYTEEQLNFIRKISDGRTRQDIIDMFNEKFQSSITLGSLRGVMNRNQIKNRMQGHSTRLQKGHEPWNKDMKGIQIGGKSTQFKVGDTHHGLLPIGSESIKEDTVWVKLEHPSKWERKHLHIWRQAHGEIPSDSVIRFKDGDKSNVVLDNLFIVTKRAMTSVVRRNLEQDDPELQVLIHTVATVELATKEREINNGY